MYHKFNKLLMCAYVWCQKLMTQYLLHFVLSVSKKKACGHQYPVCGEPWSDVRKLPLFSSNILIHEKTSRIKCLLMLLLR